MKRDMDLVRKILLQIEATEAGGKVELDVPGHEDGEIGLHVELMIEHGLVEGTTISSSDGPAHRILAYHVEKMTWEGHDFLAVARNDTIWEKAKKKCLDATGGLALDVLKACLVALGEDALGLT